MRRLFPGIAALVAVGALGTTIWILGTPLRVVTVVDGRVFRSAQPGGDDLCRLREDLRLATVVNLRGAQPDEPWYREEVEAARRCGIERLDLRLWTADWPPRAEVARLVPYLDASDGPLLLHCHSGVDRSGFAATVARLLVGHPYREALDELPSATRGRETPYGRRFFDLYERWLGEGVAEHTPERFRAWALDDYYPPPYAARLEWVGPPLPREVPPGTAVEVRVRATNRSPAPWTLSTLPGTGIRLGASLVGPYASRPADVAERFRERGRPGVLDIARSATPDGELEPGTSREFVLGFRAPEEPGLYVVMLDMVDEQVHWFNEIGGDPLLIDLIVTAP